MKKCITLLLSVLMMFTLFGCKSKEEKAREAIQNATEKYEQAKQDLDELKRQQEEVQQQIDKIESGK